MKQLSREILAFDLEQGGLKWRLVANESRTIRSCSEINCWPTPCRKDATHSSGRGFVQSSRSTKEPLCPSRQGLLPTWCSDLSDNTPLIQCTYVYQVTGGEKITLAHHVDDIICATKAPQVYEQYFIHLFHNNMEDHD